MKTKVSRVDTTKEEVCGLLEALHIKCFPSDALYNFKKGAWWVAYTEQGQPVGFAGISSPESGTAYLCRCGVVPEYRGKGLQRRFIRCRVAYAKKMRYNVIITDTTNNPASANNLIRSGFTMYIPVAPWGFNETVYWKLDAAV